MSERVTNSVAGRITEAPEMDADRLSEASEFDAADQAAPVAGEDADLELDVIARAAARSMAAPAEADPADVWEQSVPVADDDDGYGHD